MGRKAGSIDAEHFDLLPLITMLVCTLGCLLLVTMGTAALGLGPDVDEGWAPEQEKHEDNSKVPILIEWDGETLVVHLGKVATTLDLNEHGDAFLGRFEGHSDAYYAFFAVRPSGFDTFNSLAQVFREREIEVGYEPLNQDRAVKFTTPTDLP